MSRIIAVILGGTSAERQISLMSGQEVYQAIQQLSGYQAVKYDPKTDLEKLRQDKDKLDGAFIALHGEGGEDGTIQRFLDRLKIPYVGSGARASAKAIDKIQAKKIFRRAGLAVLPDWELIQGRFSAKDLAKIQLPVIVKPARNGSSVGASIVKKRVDLLKALKKAFRYDRRVLAEKYLSAREFTVAVLGSGAQSRALPVVEIIPTRGEFFDYQNKYDGSTQEVVPAKISLALTDKAQMAALQAHRALGCRGLTRTDMLLSGQIFYLLELNTLPGMTKESLAPKAARAAGLDFKQLIKILLEEALNQKKRYS